MRSFFVQIFLSFWVSTVAIFVAATVLSPRNDYGYPENLRGGIHSAITQLALGRLESGVQQSCSHDISTSLLLFDTRGRELCGRQAAGQLQSLVAQVQKSGVQQFGKAGSSWAAAVPVHFQGQTFVAVSLSQFHPPSWFPHLPPYTIPVSAFVTFVFAYLLTNPVRALRRAFRRFTAGDMSVRLPVARSALRDWGGADIRTLMIDFNEMADRIQALLEAHRTLLRDVSHELRSPLARLNVALALAREEDMPVHETLDRAELESARLNALVGELLSLSHMETIHEVPRSRTVSLGDLIEGLMPDLSFEADARQCRVVHHSRSTCAVIGSEEVLRRALENVIRNAIRYSPAGAEVVIETAAENNGGSDGKALVRISDSGPGVPEENLQAIFRPFYRVDAARQATTGGFGVGLAIADRAVHIHGGTITAANRRGGGLCVELRFPCAPIAVPISQPTTTAL